MLKLRRLIAAVCSLSLAAFCLTCCSSKAAEPAVRASAAAATLAAENGISFGNVTAGTETEQPQYAPLNTGIITGMSLDESGRLQISRATKR